MYFIGRAAVPARAGRSASESRENFFFDEATNGGKVNKCDRLQ